MNTKPCGRTIFRDLNNNHYEFAQKVRGLLRAEIDGLFAQNPTDEAAHFKWWWGCTLGVLMHDVSGSILLLLTHGERRGPVILNRSLFEYQIRLRYYCMRTDKAKEAIEQLPERFKKILRVDPTARTEVALAEREEFEAWLAQKQPIVHQSFKDHVLKTVAGVDDYILWYDGYYGKASGHVHGYETTVRDVHREYFNGAPEPTLDFKGSVFPLDDALGVCIHNLLDGLKAVRASAGISQGNSLLEQEWRRLQGS